MQKIAANFNAYGLMSGQEPEKVKQDDSEDLVNEIYIALCAIFKGCWVSTNQTEIDAYKKQLFLSFQQFEVTTQEQIEKGLFNARCAETKYFPSTKQVVDWCLDTKAPVRKSDTRDLIAMQQWADKPIHEKQKNREHGKKQLKSILSLLRS